MLRKMCVWIAPKGKSTEYDAVRLFLKGFQLAILIKELKIFEV